MQKQCTQCNEHFEITDDDLALIDKCSPEIGGKKYDLPPPTKCFDCRLQQKLAYYNCRTLYKRKCSKTGKEVMSIYSPQNDFTVYDPKAWWSDDWDPMEYGRDFDFSRPFFPQFYELLKDVPFPALALMGDNVNSDFTNDNYKTKNCYLVFDGEQAEDCYYGHTFTKTKSSMDFVFLYDSELCYECTHCEGCYNLRYCQYSKNCHDAWLLRDCIGCKDCFGCINLRQKQYCIFNEQKTKQEFESYMNDFKSSSWSAVQEAKKKAEEFFKTQPVRATRGEQNINCVGDNLSNSKNAYYCFDAYDKEDCRYFTDGMISAKDCMDVHIWGDGLELAYCSALVGAKARSVIGCYYVLLGCDSVYYSQWCTRSCTNLFGCASLRHKKHCIFNKRYSPEEYEKLAGKIVEHMQETGEWGEFFPPEASLFGYNETMAQTFFPLSKEGATSQGFQWSDYQAPVEAEKSVPASQLPDDANDVPDDVLNWAILCEKSGRPFRLVKRELEFYRQHRLPIPRRHHDERHYDRYAYKNPYKLWERICGKCSKKILTSYAPERPEKVYCVECYKASVY